MVSINIIGQIQGTTGYAIHTRELASALCKQIQVRLTTQIQPGTELELSDDEIKMIKCKAEKDEINLIITNPLHWKLNFGKRNWVYMIFEGSHIPLHYLELCLDKQIEKIIIPSEHTRRAILNSIELLNEEKCRILMEKLIWQH